MPTFLYSAMPVMFGGYWLPSLLALLYAWVLKQWHDGMLADRVNGLDPFKATSVVPSITASAMYLTIVLVTRHALKDRKAYDSKKYMSIYNLYQVRIQHLTCNLMYYLRLSWWYLRNGAVHHSHTIHAGGMCTPDLTLLTGSQRKCLIPLHW